MFSNKRIYRQHGQDDLQGENIQIKEKCMKVKKICYIILMNEYTYFAKNPKLQDDIMGYTEFLHTSYDSSSVKKHVWMQSIFSLILY